MSDPSVRGPKGETIFHEFWPWPLKEEEKAAILKRAGASLDHIKGPAPDRLLALVGALVIEDAVNVVLQAFLPGFKELRDKRDFTFSMRIGTLHALRLIPTHISADANHIREVRNAFAHDLSKTTFAQLDSKLVRSTSDRLRRMKLPISPHAAVRFQHLIVQTTAALHAYSRHVARLREYLATDAFHKSLKDWVRPHYGTEDQSA